MNDLCMYLSRCVCSHGHASRCVCVCVCVCYGNKINFAALQRNPVQLQLLGSFIFNINVGLLELLYLFRS